MKPRELWLCEKEAEGETSFQCLAYTQEPTHGAIKGLSDNYIEKAAYNKAVQALKGLVKCMVPHPIDHPSMFKAKENGEKTLIELGEDQ